MTIAITSDSELDLAQSPKPTKHRAASHLQTYKTRDAAIADRNQQLRLLNILDAIPSALRRDECGAWRVRGAKGISIHGGTVRLGLPTLLLGPQ
jgi:hypothetical protein